MFAIRQCGGCVREDEMAVTRPEPVQYDDVKMNF